MHSTLGFEIDRVRRQGARWPGSGAALALSAAALCVLLDPPLPGQVLALLVAIASLAAWAGWRSGRCRDTGRLLVDPAGEARWLAARSAAAAVPLVPRQWQLGSGEVWLLARDGEGARLHLRMGRCDCDEGQWRALRRWLVWSGRGAPKAVRT